jgi:hypothetical protein
LTRSSVGVPVSTSWTREECFDSVYTRVLSSTYVVHEIGTVLFIGAKRAALATGWDSCGTKSVSKVDILSLWTGDIFLEAILALVPSSTFCVVVVEIILFDDTSRMPASSWNLILASIEGSVVVLLSG